MPATKTRKSKPKYEARPAFEPPKLMALLQGAVEKPGTLSSDYHLGHEYSTLNKMLIRYQCLLKGIEYGIIGTAKWWKERNRWVSSGKGSAMSMAMPYVFQPDDPKTGEPKVDKDGNPVLIRRYRYPYKWFVYSQTTGEDLPPLELPDFDFAQALAELDIEVEEFQMGTANVAGYANAERKVAVNPISTHHTQTLLHEMAHLVLGHLTKDDPDIIDLSDSMPRTLKEFEAEATAYLIHATLGADDKTLSDSRGYIQHFYNGGELVCDESGNEVEVKVADDWTVHRIFKAVDTIMKAGRIDKEDAS